MSWPDVGSEASLPRFGSGAAPSQLCDLQQVTAPHCPQLLPHPQLLPQPFILLQLFPLPLYLSAPHSLSYSTSPATPSAPPLPQVIYLLNHSLNPHHLSKLSHLPSPSLSPSTSPRNPPGRAQCD